MITTPKMLTVTDSLFWGYNKTEKIDMSCFGIMLLFQFPQGLSPHMPCKKQDKNIL